MSEDPIPQDAGFSLRDYLDLLRRRKAILIQTFVAVFIIGVFITLVTKPVYESVTRILVEGKSLSVQPLNGPSQLNAIFAPPVQHDVETQLEVIKSEDTQLQAFNAANVPVTTPPLATVDARQIGETDVIEISVHSGNREYSKALAIQIPKVYRKSLEKTNDLQVNSAVKYATEALAQAKTDLEVAEKNLQSFMMKHSVVNLDKEREERITQAVKAEAMIQAAEADLAGQKAQLKQLETVRKSIPNDIETTTLTSNNLQIEMYRDNIAKLKSDRASMLILMKPSNVKVQAVDAQITDLQRHLDALPDKVATVVKMPNPEIKDYEVKLAQAQGGIAAATATLASARVQQDQTVKQLEQLSTLNFTIAELQRQVETEKDLVAGLTVSTEELALKQHASTDPVKELVDASQIKAERVAPRKTMNLIVTTFVGIVLGLCFALLSEYMDDRVNGPDEARRIVDSPILGYIPLVESEDTRLLTKARKGGSLLESYRVLRSNVQFAAVDTPTNSILVTSTMPSEGKSLTASNLAVAMALDGKRVIIVDADLRRPTLHTKFGLEQRPGLTNVLVGHTPLEEALQQTEVPGLRVLAAGPLPPNPAELLNSRSMRDVHQQLRDAADIVIFDSPPVLATADAQVLSAETDGVIYVVEFGQTKKSAMRQVNELFVHARANILGIVFNKIDMTSKRDDYYYGYYRYYNYYHSPQIEDGQPGKRRKRHTTSEFEAISQKDKSTNGAEDNALVARQNDSDDEEKS